MKVSDLIMLVKDNCQIKIVEEYRWYDCPMPNNDEWDCNDCTFLGDDEECRYGDGKIPKIDSHVLYVGRGDDCPIKLAAKLIKGVWTVDDETRGRRGKIIHTTCLVVSVEE